MLTDRSWPSLRRHAKRLDQQTRPSGPARPSYADRKGIGAADARISDGAATGEVGTFEADAAVVLLALSALVAAYGLPRDFPQGNVASLRDVDAIRFRAPVTDIEVVEIAAQTADLDANDRVVLRIEALVAAEHRHGQVKGLEAMAATSQRLLDNVGEELPSARAGSEPRRSEQPGQMVSYIVGRRGGASQLLHVSPSSDPRSMATATATDTFCRSDEADTTSPRLGIPKFRPSHLLQ